MSRKLYFNEEEHKYTDDLGNAYLSTTTLLGQYEPKFDTKGQARRLAIQGTGIYKGKSAKQIEQMWADGTKAACDKGNGIHDELEGGVKDSVKGLNVIETIVSKFTNAVKSFRQRDENDMNRLYTLDDIMGTNLKPVDPKVFYDKVGHKYPIIQKTIEWYCDQGYYLFAELGIYDEKRLISGMIDLFAYKHPYFVIIDWKTNKDDVSFESYYYKRDDKGQTTNTKVVKKNDYLMYPIDNLINCKGSKYGMQLSVYAKMCEQRGLICGGMILFHIRDKYILNQYGMPYKDDNNNYIVDDSKDRTAEYIVMEYYTKEVDNLFTYHVKTALKNGVQYKMGF